MDLFGSFFDFDGDGRSSLFEELLGRDAMGFFDTKEEEEDYEESEEDDDAFDDEDEE